MGVTVGTNEVGASVVGAVGRGVGFTLIFTLGVIVGTTLGMVVGASDGIQLGTAEGAILGVHVGCEGAIDGSKVGPDGRTLGATDGAVGLNVVGLCVGATLGTALMEVNVLGAADDAR